MYTIAQGVERDTFGTAITTHRIVAKNGRVVAECTTERMAERIIKGLNLLKYEEDKMKEFRL